MKYVIRNTETHRFVAKHPNPHSYVKALQFARTWDTRAAAEAERCPDNEVVLSVDEAMGA